MRDGARESLAEFLIHLGQPLARPLALDLVTGLRLADASLLPQPLPRRSHWPDDPAVAGAA
jgi:hypothetical protein